MEASSHSPQHPKDLLPASKDTLRSYLSMPTPIKSMLVALMAEILVSFNVVVGENDKVVFSEMFLL